MLSRPNQAEFWELLEPLELSSAWVRMSNKDACPDSGRKVWKHLLRHCLGKKRHYVVTAHTTEK